MEPDMTEDMVEGPSGRSTGQKGSQEKVFSNAIIQNAELLDSLNQDNMHILNSLHSSLKQDNEQELLVKIKLELHEKYPCITRFIKQEEEVMDAAEEYNDMGNASHKKKPKNEESVLKDCDQAHQRPLARMCVMCFRLFPSHSHQWTMFNTDYVTEFIHTSWEKPPYQDIVEGLLQMERSSSSYVPICQPCCCFIKKYSIVTVEMNDKGEEEYFSREKKQKRQISFQYSRKKRKIEAHKPRHPVHLAVNFILSGGCTLSPCYSVLNHLMESITYKFPSNPILQMRGGLLYNLTHAVLHHINEFKVPAHTYLQFISLLKWVTTGSQRILVDQRMAKRMRRYLCDFPEHEQWWKRHLPPSACRFCHGDESKILHASENISFCSVLWNSKETLQNLTKEVEKIEESKQIIDHITTFCYQCCRFSVISYEYDCSLRKTMKLHITSTRDAYYTRMIYLFGIATESRR
jgi:hypothetical protein